MRVIKVSETIQEFGGIRYYKCGRYFQKNGVRLHRVVWESINGPVPDGFHVHHADTDRSNNQITNLELKTSAKHISDHVSESGHGARTIHHAIAAAPEWHRSPDGLEWHKRQYVEKCAIALAATVDKICHHCGKSYRANIAGKTTGKFCSNNCKSAFRLASGADIETRICVCCGAEFKVNKYWTTKTCSRSCGGKIARSTR